MPHTSRSVLLLLAVAVYCLLVLPRMLTYGMFVDGVTYASIARNMAENYGSFWRPYYTATVAPIFYDQPPLGFWLQSWAYRLCGDGMYIEALWGFVSGALILVGLGKVWRDHRPPNAACAGTWFPILLFAIIPMTSWILSNNMLENSMTVFIMASVCASLLGLKSPRKSLSLFYGLLSGFNAFLAFLVKGPVALFALVVPLISIIKREERIKKIFLVNLCVIFAFLFSLVFIVANNNDARYFLLQYIRRQVIESISGTRELSESRFNMLFAVCRDILVPIILCLLSTGIMYKVKKPTIRSINYRLLLYYTFIALISSMPIIISKKQMRWYVFPSFPFYILAISVVFNDIALAVERFILEKKNVYKNVVYFSISIFFLSILMMFLGKNYIGRNKEFYHDFSMQALHIEPREIISVYPENLLHNWSLVANMQRQFKASLAKDFGHQYLLSTIEYNTYEDIRSMYKFFHPQHPQKYILFRFGP
jgi:4-amino-4-deoxy-L-arabinose transferase-like glycosyltransferase